MNTGKFRCWFCRMPDPHRLLRVPVCGICRDQLYDFFWVTVVQTVVWLFGGMDGLFFVINECLLFFVLIFVKHWVPAPWDRQR